VYDSSIILAATGLYTRVGLREPSRTDYAGILDATAKTTKSGKYYDDFHPLANFVNIKDCQDDKDISNANLNTLIATWQKGAIEDALSRVFTSERDLLQTDLQFKNENKFEDKITNSGKFVGFEFSTPDDIVNILNSVILQFDGAVNFSLYLFHSSKKAAIQTFEATTIADDFYKLSLDKSLFSKSSTYGAGKFYIGYFQNDLGAVKAYDRIWNNSGSQTRFNCLRPRSFSATPNGLNMFDLDTIQYGSESWGMNLDISSYRDYTNLILNNQGLFDSVQGYAFSIRILELIKTTARMNTTTRSLADMANYDLSDQSEPTSIGLYTKMKIEVSRVRKSLFNDSMIIV
jgi:hypothetical protein